MLLSFKVQIHLNAVRAKLSGKCISLMCAVAAIPLLVVAARCVDERFKGRVTYRITLTIELLHDYQM